MLDRPAHRTWPRTWIPALSALVALTVLPQPSASGSELRQSPVVKAVQRVRPSVVNIRGEKTVTATVSQTSGGEGARRVNGMGTGVVIAPQGYIVTNFHVVDGVREIQVTTAEGKRYIATLVARDLETDLAVIKIDVPEKMPVITVGTSADLMPGETVIAVGNAFGYEHTVTTGIVSALHRAVQVSDAQFYDDLIQTSAGINPGNSGGPLLNIDGEMIAINVAVRAGAQQIGFAIPVDRALHVAAGLLASSGPNKVWHGVTAAADTPAVRPGMAVASVEKKSPAAESGLQPGDVITAAGGAEVKRALDFQRAMLERKPGEKVKLTIERGGAPQEMSLTLADLPETARPTGGAAWEVLGLELKPMPAGDFRQKYQTRYRGGLMVAEVRPNSPASDQGIRPGDVLVGMHVWETISMDNVLYILKRSDFTSLNPVKFFILRGNETLYGYMPVAMKTARRE